MTYRREQIRPVFVLENRGKEAPLIAVLEEPFFEEAFIRYPDFDVLCHIIPATHSDKVETREPQGNAA